MDGKTGGSGAAKPNSLLRRVSCLARPAVWAICLVSLAACVGLAVAFDPVERVTKVFGNRLVRLVIKDKPTTITAN